MSTTGSVISFDLSAYAGQSEVRVTFESACKYGPSYANGAYQGMILVDDISSKYCFSWMYRPICE